MTTEQEEKPKTRIGLIVASLVGLLLVLGILYLLLFQGALPWSGRSTRARTLSSVNLRQGPGIGYLKTGSVPAGTEVTVLGRSQDGSWLVVETETGDAWMTGDPTFVEINAGALARLPVVEAPPLAYDASNIHVNQVLNQIPLVIYHRDHFTCASHAGLNNLLPSVEDGNVIGPHSGDFVLIGKENVLLEYSNGLFQLIRDNPIARFDGGEKYLSLEETLQMFENEEIIWTGRFGDWPGRGVPGCDESSKPG